jgi:cytochrome o ubiquinol oxidase subunit 2
LKAYRNLLLIPLLAGLSACHMVVLDPAGHVAIQERNLLVASTALMLLIIVPVLVLTAVFAWRYRHSRKQSSDYEPDWEHSLHLELAIWAAPLLIIIALGALTWIGTHKLDPYRQLEQQSAATGSDAPKTINVDVVSLDWKWLFIYPDYGIATVNQLAAPVDVPIHFRLTSDTVMNSFYVPALAGQIYTMAGMMTQLNAVINKVGNYKGFSANISGDGFTDMRFRFLGMTRTNFKQWVDKVKSKGGELNVAAYRTLTKPTRDAPVHYYATYSPDLFSAIVHRCVDSSASCPHAMAMAGLTAQSAAPEASADAVTSRIVELNKSSRGQ